MAGANPPIPITPAKLATRAVTGHPTPCAGSRSITPNYWCPSPTRPPLLPWPSLPPLPSSPLNQNPRLKPSYRNSLTPPQRSGAPLKLAPSCCQNRFVTQRPTPNSWPTTTTLNPPRNSRTQLPGTMTPPRRKNAPNAPVTPRKSLSRRLVQVLAKSENRDAHLFYAQGF
jgi:hypothetical protein